MAYRKHSQLPSQPPPPVAAMMSTVAQPDEQESSVFVVETPEQFAALLDKYKLTIVDVWQENCAPCDALAPSFHDLADTISENHADSVAFATINARSGVVQVQSTPMILVYSYQNPTPIAQYSAVDGFNTFTGREFYPMLRNYGVV